MALFFILFFTVANNKAASTPEEFARSVVELLATSDSEELLEFIFPSKEQLRDFAITEIKSVPEDRIEEFLEKLDEIYAEQKQEVLDSLERLRSDAASSGCHLENASFVKCKHEDVSLENDIFLTITESGKNYGFSLGDCSLINGRWYNISGVSGFQGQRERSTGIFSAAKEDSARIQLQSFSKSLMLYKIDMGNYPTPDQGLDGLVDPPNDKSLAGKYPVGGYLDASEIPLDPWENKYLYESARDSTGLPGFVISSAGPDGQAGNDDDIVVKSR